PGFRTPIEAAMFANGFGEFEPTLLTLEAGAAVVRMSPQIEIKVGDRGGVTPAIRRAGLCQVTIRAWRLPADACEDEEVIGDGDLVEVPINSMADLSAAGLDGAWHPVAYDVVGPAGRVGVTIDLDDTGMILGVAVDHPDTRDLEEDTPQFTVVPKA